MNKDIQEFRFDYLDKNNGTIKTKCPYIESKIGSCRCAEACKHNKGTDYKNNVVKCSHPKSIIELFNCACPYCDSEQFTELKCDLDDTRCYVLAKCDNCNKKFDLTYACINVDKIKGE